MIPCWLYLHQAASPHESEGTFQESWIAMSTKTEASRKEYYDWVIPQNQQDVAVTCVHNAVLALSAKVYYNAMI